jgi:hypothetical protein
LRNLRCLLWYVSQLYLTKKALTLSSNSFVESAMASPGKHHRVNVYVCVRDAVAKLLWLHERSTPCFHVFMFSCFLMFKSVKSSHRL